MNATYRSVQKKLGLVKIHTRRYFEPNRYVSWLPLPPRLQGLIDWHLFPRLRGGIPLNGQEARIELVRELITRDRFEAIVETGTFRGLTTIFMSQFGQLPVLTVEADERSFSFAAKRFQNEDRIVNSHGDSREFLKRLLDSPLASAKRVFFYLDAHGSPDLPLFEELEIIASGWPDPVIMIDDFQVPDDPGYHFDDYGSGKALKLEYLPPTFTQAFHLYWPRTPSQEDTGSRRGCVVACRKDSKHPLDQVHLLRSALVPTEHLAAES